MFHPTFLLQDPNENHDAPDEQLMEAVEDNLYPIDEEVQIIYLVSMCFHLCFQTFTCK